MPGSTYAYPWGEGNYVTLGLREIKSPLGMGAVSDSTSRSVPGHKKDSKHTTRDHGTHVSTVHNHGTTLCESPTPPHPTPPHPTPLHSTPLHSTPPHPTPPHPTPPHSLTPSLTQSLIHPLSDAQAGPPVANELVEATPGNAPPPGAGDFHLSAFTCQIGTLSGRA